MVKSSEKLALHKQLLLARLALYRLDLSSEMTTLQNSLSWLPLGIAVAKSIPLRTVVFGFAMYGAIHSRLPRALTLVAKTVLVAKLVSIAFSLRPKSLKPRCLLSGNQR